MYIVYLITVWVFTCSCLANEIFLTKITHSETDTIRHLSVITDQFDNLSAFKITEFEEDGPIYNFLSFDELTGEIYVPPVPFSKFASMDAQLLSRDHGGRMTVTYSPNIFATPKYMIDFDLLKENHTWVLYDVNVQPVIHLKLMINKKALVPVGIKKFIINP